MLKNYFKIAFRNLLRYKIYSFINIAGLAAGMAVALLIGLWLNDELGFDKSFANYKRLGQVWQFVKFNSEKSSFDVMPVPLAAELREKYPDIKSASLSTGREVVLGSGDKKLSETGNYVEVSFPEMFSLKMISGSRSALSEVHAVLINATLAKSMFGSTAAINQLITFNDTTTVKVAGVFEDFPANSQFKTTHFLAPWSLFAANESWVREASDHWDDNNFNIYVQLNEKADFANVSAKIKDIRTKRDNPPSYKPEFFIHPMSRWHLYGDFKNGANSGGLITYVWLFGVIGAFVLFLACINFMNLSTARSEKRAKEVGIRKTIGSMRWQLVGQFFSESVVYVFLAFILALILTVLSLPFFNELSGKQMSIFWSSPQFWLAVIGFCLFTSLLAGSYPALYLSGFEAVKVLKGTFKAGRLASLPRKVLVVVQFTVSASMIIGTIVVFRQVQFVKDRPSGYNRNGLLEIKLTNNKLPEHFEAVRNDLINSGAVVSAAESSCPITMQYGGTTDVSWKDKTPDQNPLFMGNSVSLDFGKTIDWKIKSGRDFSRDFTSDSSAIVLNESAVALMGFKNPLDEIVISRGKQYRVIGVVKDMIRESPFQRVNPTFYAMNFNNVSVINIKLAPQMATAKAINKVAGIFEKYDPATPFNYHFVDEQYNAKFDIQERIGKLAGFFASLAIFISCLGLFGLASFLAEQRTREIGIRKTLGASILNVWKLLSTEFIVLVSISLLIAIPLAYAGMKRWLQDYEYRTDLSWWIFALVAIASVLITLLTVSFQAIKAAVANPVKSLRS